MTEPPLPIPLTDKQLQDIGETCAILGQIDLFMQQTVMWLLNVPQPVAAAIMGSTDARARAGVWREIVQAKCADVTAKALSEDALKRFESISGQRNDFIHAFFGTLVEFKDDSGNVFMQGISHTSRVGEPVAVRVRSHKHKPAAAVTTLREEAAQAAWIFREIAQTTYQQWHAQRRA
jgi:hypothetical protein